MAPTAIVTGGTGGLGTAVVARLLGDGWRVVVPWITQRETERLDGHERLELIRADVSDPAAAAEVVARAGDDLRGLVNLAGGYDAPGRVHETEPGRFAEQFRRNVDPTYTMIHLALPPMLAAGGGSIVCVGTRAAVQPFPGAAGYIASKAAVIALAQAVAAEYRQDGIRANAILPSVIDTPANRAAMPDAKHERWVRPAEIAGVVAHLLGPDSVPTSGAVIPVYGRA
jgi:NAD(P)-dependent dehydrogenase (short-subunit alcohol dehydrogenase family)